MLQPACDDHVIRSITTFICFQRACLIPWLIQHLIIKVTVSINAYRTLKFADRYREQCDVTDWYDVTVSAAGAGRSRGAVASAEPAAAAAAAAVGGPAVLVQQWSEDGRRRERGGVFGARCPSSQ